MKDRHSFLRISFILGVFGVLSLLAGLGRPTMADIRAVDFVRLIGAGMCLGGAVVALVAHYRNRHSN